MSPPEKATPLPLEDPQAARERTERYTRDSRRRTVLWLSGSFLWLYVLWRVVLLLHVPLRVAPRTMTGGTDVPSLGVPKHIQKMWGQYAPWHPAGHYVPPPDGCNITQVCGLYRASTILDGRHA